MITTKFAPFWKGKKKSSLASLMTLDYEKQVMSMVLGCYVTKVQTKGTHCTKHIICIRATSSILLLPLILSRVEQGPCASDTERNERGERSDHRYL